MTVAIRKIDLSQYETFRVSGPLSNNVTIAIRGHLIPWSHPQGKSQYTIHILIWGDFGPWENYWNAAGGENETWWNWLHSTDRDYFLNKVVGDYQKFDLEKSKKVVHKELYRMRRIDRDISKDVFREGIELLRDMEACGEESFVNQLSTLSQSQEAWSSYHNRMVRRDVCVFDEPWGYLYSSIKPELAWFWDNIWRPFIEQAKATKGFTK